MGWRLDERTSSDFTFEQIEKVSSELGVPWHIVDPLSSFAHARAVLCLFDSCDIVDALTLADLERRFAEVDDDDLPIEYSDGIPVDGGRWSDQWVVWGAGRFHWPPDVTRRQTLRDLRLLSEATDVGDD